MKERIRQIVKRIRIKKYCKKIEETGEVPYPDTVVFEPTMRCNLRCKMCYINFPSIIKDTKNELTTKQIKQMIDKFPDTIKRINLIGGEPLLRQDITEILDYIHNKGIKIAISTNLTLLNEKLIKYLHERNILNDIIFSISIDGKRETHDKIRGEGKFDLVVKNINLLQKYKSNVDEVTCVITEDNIHNLKDIIEVLHELKIKKLLLEYERRQNKNAVDVSASTIGIKPDEISVAINDKITPDYSFETLKDSLNKAEIESKKLGIRLNYLPNKFKKYLKEYYEAAYRGKRKNYCGYLKIVRITPGGDVVGCFMVRKKFGNLLENSFEEIWNCNEFKEYRKRLIKNNLMPICNHCLYMI